MPKTRGRKRYTRNMRSTWKKRRPCVRKTQRKRGNKKRSMRMRGGVSTDDADTTFKQVDGQPITEKAVITTSDGFSGGVKDAEKYFEYRDFQGPEQM